MAIGDAVIARTGTAQTDHQPSAGVEEVIRAVGMTSTTDSWAAYDGSQTVNVATMKGSLDADVKMVRWHLNNTTYARKTGTTDFGLITGITTNV